MTGEIESSPPSAPSAPAEVVKVKQRRAQREGVFGFLTAVVAIALGWGAASAHTTTGRMVIFVVFGALLVAIVGGWLWLVVHPSYIEVSPQRIRFVAGRGRPRPDLVRDQGDELTIYTRQSDNAVRIYLEQQTTTIHWSLPLFSRKSVGRACRARGWRVVETRRPG
jgi:hypothetical protein